MKILISVLACLVLIPAVVLRPAHAAGATSVVGLWKTIDDKTGEPRALVRISAEHGTYVGRIEQSFRPGAATRVCSACTDDRKDKPIIGLEIIRGMSGDDSEYSGGHILDPDNGTVYRCKMRLEEGGRKLVVRGYIGISLLGRSQTWVREQ